MVVDEGTVRALREGSGQLARIFAASCAERLVQVFCAARATDLSRADDIAYVVETLEDLWDLKRPTGTFDDRREHLLSFPELQPNEMGFTQVADIYSFYGCLVLMYATKCAAAGGDPEAAVSCAHASLTAMGQLDQNVAGATFFSEEKSRQEATIDRFGKGAPVARIRDDDRIAAQELVTAIQDRISGE
ncbi:hypothetical protein [Dactylosporangium sp. CA-092794]|uniref:hypothetical protein n=1 Tax=Dactylosporangium sp. CA-092794 TaxID=3239929 RepID=UPI003D8E1D6F